MVFFPTPTPGSSNERSGYTELLGKVQFSIDSGFHSTPVSSELSSLHDNVEILYTLDGSEPADTPPLYESPIHITDRTTEPNDLSAFLGISHNYANATPPAGNVFKGTVVRAVAFRGGALPSPVTTHTYFSSEEFPALCTKRIWYEQIYPNPFNNNTVISYRLADSGTVSLHIFSVLGTLVARYDRGHQPAGRYILYRYRGIGKRSVYSTASYSERQRSFSALAADKNDSFTLIEYTRNPAPTCLPDIKYFVCALAILYGLYYTIPLT